MGEIFTIPAGIPFAKSLASKLLEDHINTPETLPDTLILLPTRRACRTVREAFLQLNEGKPIMLPSLQAIGDIDEEELSISIAGEDGIQNLLDLPPILPSIQRQILLAKAIKAHKGSLEGFDHQNITFDQALNLAKTLGNLMDQIYTENLDIKNLANLVPENFSDHWQITLDFLKILSEKWPEILNSLNVIDAADKRNRLINALSDFWEQSKPQKRIIAAGTTGSIPATAKLLNTIYNLPHGQIILPGLDQAIDNNSWDSLSENHPQYGFKHLLSYMNIDKDAVLPWVSNIQDHKTSQERRCLSSELMRPEQTSQHWQKLESNSFDKATKNLKIFECDTPQHEAQIIATMMRQTLENPHKKAALITPDRNLAQRVSMACKRWNITIDDSAGQPLTQTKLGNYLILTLECITNALSPVSLLALLKHPLTNPDLKTHLQTFEVELLRGFKPAKGIAGLLNRWSEKDENPDLKPLIDTLETLFSDLLDTVNNNQEIEFKSLLQKHIQLCENLHSDESLWAGEDGNAASKLLSEIIDQAHNFPRMSASEYLKTLQQFMSGVTLRPAYGIHPRLQILGQLEARLIDADLVILGGLNEGTWPSDPGHDPWMSRPMRQEYGLPGAERSIGLSSHDFVQGFCAPNIALTRSKLIDGAPSVSARWLQRLYTVLDATNFDFKTLQTNELSTWVKALDHEENPTPYKRPDPKPPIECRPHKLSVTKIETWLKDPYSIYAYSILKLRKIDPLEKQADAAIRGEMLHESLHEFITQNPKTIPNNADHIILNAAQNFVAKNHQSDEDWHFYWPRFEKITAQFLQKEKDWRAQNNKPLKTEITGEATIKTNTGDFLIYGRADRIDKTSDGAAIIDYKSGGNFTQKGLSNGDNPQLPIEGLIIQNGGFEGIPPTPCKYIGYWLLNGKEKHTEETDPHDILVDTEDALKILIETFDNPDTPYYAIPRSTKIPRYNDYEHLARTKEWAALDDAESDAA